MKSLSGKILLALTAYSLGALMIVAALAAVAFHARMSRDMERKAVTLVSDLASSPELLAGEGPLLSTLAKQFLSEGSVVYLVVVSDPDGPTRRETAPAFPEKALEEIYLSASPGEGPAVRRLHVERVGEIMDIAVAMPSGREGIVHLGLSRTAMGARVREQVGELVAIMGAVLLLGFGPVAFLVRRITRPLRDLSRHAERIAEGDHFSTVCVDSRDEFGALAAAVNHMVYVLWDKIGELKKTEEKFRGLFENALEGVFQSTPDGRFLLVNPALARSLGFDSPEQMIDEVKDSYTELYVRREDREEFVRRMLTEGRVRNFDVEVRRRDGETRWLSLTARSILVGREGPPVFEGMVEDVTERKRAEEALRASEANYRDLVEKVDVAIVVVQEGRISYANPRLLELSGFSAEEMIDKDYLGFLDEEDKEKVRQSYHRLLAGEAAPSFDARIPAKDASELWVEVSGVLGLWEGRPAVLAVLNDITERELAARTVKVSEEKYRMLVEHVNVGILVIQDGVMQYINPRLMQVSGYSEEEVVGRPFADLTYPDDVEMAYANHLRRLRGEKVDPYLLRIIAKDGSLRWLEVDGLICEWEGRPAGINFLNDVTERVLADQALAASEEKFRALVECANVSILVLQDGLIKYGNPYHARNIGYTQEECHGTPFLDLVYEEDRELAIANYTRRQEGEQVPQYILRTVSKNGVVRWKEVTGVPLEWEGRAAGLVFLNDVSERMLANQALAASEKQYRELVECANSVILRMDLEGRVTFINSFGQSFFGYSASEILGKRVIDTIVPAHDSSGRDNDEMIRGLLTNPGAYALNVNENLRKDGSKVWVSWSNKGILDEEGRLVEILSIGADETDRILAQMELAEQDLRQKAILDNIPDIAWLKDEKLRFVAVNQQFARACGLSPEDIVGKTDRDIWPPELAEGYVAGDLRVMGEKRSLWAEEMLETKDRGVVWHETYKTPVLNIRGEVVGTTGVGRDITDRKLAEEALRRSEQKHRTLLNNIPYKIIYKDAESVYVTVNPSFARDYRLPPDDFTGLTDFDLYPAALAEKYRADDRRVMDAGVSDEYDEEYEVDGKTMVVHTCKVPILNASGRPEGILIIFWDVTARKQTEETLRQAEKMKAIGTLAGGIAHDFNNILGAIVNLTTLARRQLPPGGRTVQDLDQVLATAERGKNLVRQILTFSRPGREAKTVFSPLPIVREVLSLLRTSLPSSIELREDIFAAEPSILGDEAQFHQVVMNLCANAVDAMRETGGVLEVSLGAETVDAASQPPHPMLQSGRYLVFKVTDTGPGIAPELQERIFELFFTTKAPGRGTGLGLAVAHSILARHGGAVVLDSIPGKGTTFRAYFPIHVEHAPQVEPPESQAIIGHGCILFVDDEAMLVQSSKLLLESLGYSVVTARSGEEALELFLPDPDAFDVVITDLTMPGMTGSELAAKVKSLRPETPIVLCTGFSETLTAEDAAGAGISRFFYKPIDWNEMSAAIESLIRKHQE